MVENAVQSYASTTSRPRSFASCLGSLCCVTTQVEIRTLRYNSNSTSVTWIKDFMSNGRTRQTDSHMGKVQVHSRTSFVQIFDQQLASGHLNVHTFHQQQRVLFGHSRPYLKVQCVGFRGNIYQCPSCPFARHNLPNPSHGYMALQKGFSEALFMRTLCLN